MKHISQITTWFFCNPSLWETWPSKAPWLLQTSVPGSDVFSGLVCCMQAILQTGSEFFPKQAGLLKNMKSFSPPFDGDLLPLLQPSAPFSSVIKASLPRNNTHPGTWLGLVSTTSSLPRTFLRPTHYFYSSIKTLNTTKPTSSLKLLWRYSKHSHFGRTVDQSNWIREAYLHSLSPFIWFFSVIACLCFYFSSLNCYLYYIPFFWTTFWQCVWWLQLKQQNPQGKGLLV